MTAYLPLVLIPLMLVISGLYAHAYLHRDRNRKRGFGQRAAALGLRAFPEDVSTLFSAAHGVAERKPLADLRTAEVDASATCAAPSLQRALLHVFCLSARTSMMRAGPTHAWSGCLGAQPVVRGRKAKCRRLSAVDVAGAGLTAAPGRTVQRSCPHPGTAQVLPAHQYGVVEPACTGAQTPVRTVTRMPASVAAG